MRTRVEFDRKRPVRVWEGELPVIPEGTLLHARALGVPAARVQYACITLKEGGVAEQTLLAH